LQLATSSPCNAAFGLPIFGLSTTLAESMAIGAIFTALSIVRSYALRRMFEAIRTWAN
jgi:hypothetical protein